MRYDDIEVREVEVDGETIIQIDGYHRPTPESKYTEYRRNVLVDLTPAQAKTLYDDLGTLLEE